MKIINKINELQSREKIPKYEKYKSEERSNITNVNKKKMYDYLKCDYCNDEIRLDIKKHERSGGIVIFPDTLTKKGKLKLVLCNKCLKSAISEFIN